MIGANQETQQIAELILRRRLQMLIHSRLYYTLDQPIWSDWEFTEKAKELAELQEKYPDISKKVEWYEEFEDWDGSSGAFLPLNHTWVVVRTNYILKLHEVRKKG